MNTSGRTADRAFSSGMTDDRASMWNKVKVAWPARHLMVGQGTVRPGESVRAC